MASDLESLASQLKGDKFADFRASLKRMAVKLRELGGPEHLPLEQDFRSPFSRETQRLIDHLRRNGNAVYETRGRTPISLVSEGMSYGHLNSALGIMTARPALLAISRDPAEFYLKGSPGLSFEEQLILLAERQAEDSREYPDSGIITRMAFFPEWAGLALAHFKATGVKLFRDVPIHTWTDNLGPSSRGVAGWKPDGFYGAFWPRTSADSDLGLAAVIEIPRL